MHPIIALWTHPRSISTAFERVMMERGDLKILHEPFSYLYYVDGGDATISQQYSIRIIPQIMPASSRILKTPQPDNPSSSKICVPTGSTGWFRTIPF